MPTRNDALTARLARSREINISVIGRKSGRTISNPVWFVLDGDKLYLLPVQGSDTQWYKNRSGTRRFRSRQEAQRLDLRPFLSLTPKGVIRGRQISR